MLLERLTYADDLPMNITVANITEDPLHYHLDIEITYVLRGSVRLKNGYRCYTLQEGDIFTNSGHEVHSITALTEDNVVAQIQISTHYYFQFFPNLSKACYRTYSRKLGDKKHNRLRELLLQILLKYTTRGFNYKSKCIYLMVDTIKHLNKYFNLFAFDQEVVVAFEKSNPVAVERISRICQYIYQYYADNITLEDLSAVEHLSTYYLSHIIKSFTGMSFREFLCFARVEWSEIMLLDSDAKISRIAREVGFSTTAYYKKYFKKWFSLTPEEHRARYLPLVKSDLRPAVMEPLPMNKAAALIRQVYANYNLRRGNGDIVSSINLEVEVDTAAALGRFEKTLTVIVTLDDYKALGLRMFALLESLAPHRVLLLQREEDSPEDLGAVLKLLRREGRTAKQQTETDCVRGVSAAYDSILYPIYLFRCCLKSENGQMSVFLRDTDSADKLLQGQSALVTANGICKPSYYFYLAAAHTQGSIICQSNQYCVVREEHADQTVFKLFVYNADKELLDLCRMDSTQEQVKSAVNDFKSALEVSMNIRLPPGQYAVTKYSLTREGNIFGYMANMGFPDDAAVFSGYCPEIYSGAPVLEVYPDDVRTILNIHFSIKSAGAQMAIIRPIQQNAFP
ncbi:AraC family transcriptional regulator [Oscillibacter sp. 1-3]|uniref:helix-turn-helix domain-containing protein n=1 Tax=Oscillibacter sp. 1-3 TaxID=1235797 RepID=UPI000338C708|nr:AraC family transcriptional regulator [Oscillibacter sp. 1-3]EOS64189.1 hypothetical protein C816_03056 [Oscillibacter sp. 1-3]MCI9512268.1 AraC family transcriptional regulator [Oscillibacter sp.]